MPIRTIDEYKRRREYFPPHWMDNVREEVRALRARGEAGERVTLAEWLSLRANSYEREFLIAVLSDEAFAKLVEHGLRNTTCFYKAGPSETSELLARLVAYREAAERLAKEWKTWIDREHAAFPSHELLEAMGAVVELVGPPGKAAGE